jgi:hypothetical protein
MWPTTFILSYEYKAIFLGLDHIRSEAGLSPIGLADTWVPAATAVVVLIFAAATAVRSFDKQREVFVVAGSAGGTAFLFGAGIYCGTYELGLFGSVLGVLWLNGNAAGHSGFLLLPQLLDWFLFFCMAHVLVLNFLRTTRHLTRKHQEGPRPS